MLEQLALSFKVIGDGINKLKQIDAQIQALKTKISNFQNSVKNKISSTFSTLKNKVTSSFQTIFSKLKSGLNRVQRSFKSFGNYASQQFQNVQNKANSFMGILKRIAGMITAGFTIKTAIEGAGNIEQFRNTLETVLKDPDMARRKLAWASRFANKTPFETEEVVGGMTKLQSYGIEGDRVLNTTNRTYLEMIGDMASGMGKSFDQAIEAVADARTGELERLKEFGITKNMIAEFGKSKGLDIFNNKGQIQDMELFNKTLFEMMDSRFGGAMEKQAKTFKGGLSTISGALKSTLSTLAGVNEFGDIVDNSPFQILRDKVIIPFASKLVELQENGTFTRWAENLSEIFEKIINIGGKVIDFIKDWKEVLMPLASALAGLFIINKVVVLIGALQTALTALSFNPVMLAIGAVIGIGVLLYRNWDLIKEKLVSLWSKIKAFSKALWDTGKKIFVWLSPIGLIITIGKLIIQNWELIKAKFSELGNYLYNKIVDIGNFFIGLKDKTVEVFNKLVNKLKTIWGKVKISVSTVFSFISNYIKRTWESIKNKFTDVKEYLYSKIQDIRSFQKAGHDFIVGIFTTVWTAVTNCLNSIWEYLKGIWKKIKAFQKAGHDFIVGIFTSIWNHLKSIWQKLKTSVSTIFSFISNYIKRTWESIKNKFADVKDYLYSKIQDIGYFFVGLKDKVVDTFNKLVETLKGVWEKIKSSISSAFDYVLDYVNQIWEKIKSFFSDLDNKIKSLPGVKLFFKVEDENRNTGSKETVVNGSHKTGLDYVPFDGYIAELHKGERVLTKEENFEYSNLDSENTNISNINNSAEIKNKNISNINKSRNIAKTDKKIIVSVNINIASVKSDTDWDRVAEMIREQIQDVDLYKDIEEGLV